jgi:hypothetical protein
VTGNHPIRVEGIGWKRADKLKEGDIVRLANGGSTKITTRFPVFRTENPGVGWAQNVKHPLADPANGWLFDYENYQIVPDEEAEYDTPPPSALSPQGEKGKRRQKPGLPLPSIARGR